MNVVRRGFSNAVRVSLAVTLLAGSAPAAPRILFNTAVEWQGGAAIWLETSSLAGTIKRLLAGGGAPSPRPQEEQTSRDSRVSRLRISPGEANILLGERVYFAAIAYDQEDEPVGGVRYKWSAYHSEKDQPMGMSPDGSFFPQKVGTFRIVAEGAGQKAEVLVHVRAGANPRGRKGEQPATGRPVSTRTPSPTTASRPLARPGAKRAAREGRAGSRLFLNASYARPGKAKPSKAAAPAFLPDYSWDDGNYWAADDPGNSVGNPPGSPADGGAGSGNFQIHAPLINLESRGTDLALNLVYNSRVWSRADSEYTFDADRDWPAPGWSLGFGKLMRMGNQGSILFDADGTRHSYGGTKYPSGDFIGHTTDGTFIDYSSWDDGFGGIAAGQARMSNGTVVQYGARNQNVAYPTRITDVNGNFITITYRNGVGPQIDTVVDTMGRFIQFHYDSNNLLTAITAPGLGGGSRTLVRLHYRQHTLEQNFAGTVRIRDAVPWVVDAIYYPATSTGYWFGESDSYSCYGMIAKVSERRGMGLSATSLNEQGTIISAGSVSRLEVYDYPLTPATLLSDAPTYSKLTVTWDGMDTPPAETQYVVNQNATPRRVEVTQPDGTKSIQLSHNYSTLPANDPDKIKDGLVYQDETRDANNNLLHSSTVEWAPGDYDSPRPSRAETINNEIGKKTATEFEYGPYNQVTTTRNYDYADINATPSVLLKTTRTLYENDASYTNARHIFNLSKKVEVFAADNTRVSLTEYQYDGSSLQLTPEVVQHDPTYDPSSGEQCGWEPDQTDPDYINGPGCQTSDTSRCDGVIPDVWVCHPIYNAGTDKRGLVTQVETYSGPASEPATGAVTETRAYDITGNVVKSSSSCCEQTSFNFTLATQYAYPMSKTRGAADPNSPVHVTTGATYDFNTGLALSTTDAGGHTTNTSYDTTSLRPQERIAPAGARTTYAYDDSLLKITETTRLSSGGAVAAKSVIYFNGAGQVRREESLAAPESSTWETSALDVVEAKYDVMGREWKKSRPYRDGSETPQWTTNFYDALGRVWKSEGADGSVNRAYFNDHDPAHPRPGAASSAPGETSLVVDAWGRERWGRFDSQGRLVEVVEPDPDGAGGVTTGGLLTTYVYDTPGRLTDIYKEAQHRRFAYDGLGRVTRQKLAETTAVFNDAGQYVGPGGAGAVWSELFAYDNRSNLVLRTDARNVRTNFLFEDAAGQPDPLNRLQKITYTVQTGSIPAADTVVYTYETTDDLTRLSSTTTKDASTGATRTTEAYRFDTLGHVDQRTLTLASRPDFALVTNYTFDNLDRITNVIYPRQYPTLTRKTIHHDYDVASRLSALTVDGAAYASQLDYNAASQAKTIKIGAAGNNQVTEQYVYDPTTGLLSEQRTYRGTNENENRLLHLSYNFLRPNTNGGRTGQLTKVTDYLNQEKGRAYTYDALGRLKQAAGGDPASAPLWTQTYSYDHYGNRTGTVAAGNTAGLKPPAEPAVKTPDVELAANAVPEVPEFLREKKAHDVTDAPVAPLLSARAARGATAAPFAPGAPSGLSVTTASAAQIGLSWTAPAGGASYYEVERGQTLVGPYMQVGTTTANTFADTTASAGAAYLYRVRAVDGSASRSGPSNVALGVAFTFTDATLTGGVTTIQASHLSELRQVVNTVRGVAGLAAATWTDSTLTPQSSVISAAHIQELRNRLNEALTALQISTSPFTDPTLGTGAGGTTVKKVHVEELRLRASRGQSGSAGGAQPAPVPRDGFDSLSYDSASNRINAAGWEYDAAGNQTRVQVASNVWRRYEYDAANRLVAAKNDAYAVLASYTYASSNMRLMSQEGGLRTYYAWGGGGGIVAEYMETDGTPSANSPQWSKNYVYMGDRLLATQRPVTGAELVEYYHPDRLGARVVSNGTDQSYYEQTSLPYGTALAAESTGQSNRRFTSYDRSQATGLDYAINRSYDAQQGRFTQVDPLGMKAASLENPQSLNLYSYVGNDPVNHVDPDGLFFGWVKKFFRAVFKILVLVVIAVIVAVAVLTMVQLGWMLLYLFVGLLVRNFVLGVVNGIIEEVREHGFTFGSFFKGLGKGVARFFKGGAITYGNYCGPFNPNQRAGHAPIDMLDAACQLHDMDYAANRDNRGRLRADSRLFLRALFSFAFSDSIGSFYSLIVVVIFGVSIIKRSIQELFGRSQSAAAAAAAPTEVSGGGARPSYKNPTRENHTIHTPIYSEVVNPAPQRLERFRLYPAPG